MRSIATLEEKCLSLLSPAIELIEIDPDHRSRSRPNNGSHLNNQQITRTIRVSRDQINTSEVLIK